MESALERFYDAVGRRVLRYRDSRRRENAAGRSRRPAQAAAGLAYTGGKSDGGSVADAVGRTEWTADYTEKAQETLETLLAWWNTLASMLRRMRWRCNGWCASRCRFA